MQTPNLDKTKEEQSTNNYFTASTTQQVGCLFCALNGEVELPVVIYHYAGTSYCLDHLVATINEVKE